MSAVATTDLTLGQAIDVAIEKAVYRGRGLGRVGGRVVFVPRAYPGDRVRARVSSLHSGWAEAALQAVLEPAPARRPAPCPQGPGCGGCTYQEVVDAEQLRLKEAVVRETLARAGAPWHEPITVHPSPERAWRTRASLHFASAEERLRLGFRREGTHRVDDLRACLQLSDAMSSAARALRDQLSRRSGVRRALRALDLLEAPDGSALAASLATTLPSYRASELADLGRQVPGLTGFGVECHGGRRQWLHGAPHLDATVLGMKLRAHVGSFFQANRFLLEPLAQTVVELVPREGGPILDLYAGVGLFALPLSAREDGRVTAVERAGLSCEDARANATRHRLRVEVVESDVAEALRSLPTAADERIVLDPPRGGAGVAVVDLLALRRPSTVVYVSCDPPTLGRDLQRFAVHGYRPDSLQILDLFPNTYHVETIARLRRG